MSCRELERLLSGGREDDFASHRASCASCEELWREMERFAETAAALRPPAAAETLREALNAIPRQTVSCEGAERLLALAAENEIGPEDSARLQSHFSRCRGCAEAAAVLGVARDLAPPEPAPWLAARLAASRSRARPERRSRRLLLTPRGAVVLAYAAAALVMALGLNPADLARKAGTARLEQSARSEIQTARASALDRWDEIQRQAFRTFEAIKGRAGGYGRAALSNVLALVMKTRTQRAPERPRREDGSGVWKKDETEILTGRA